MIRLLSLSACLVSSVLVWAAAAQPLHLQPKPGFTEKRVRVLSEECGPEAFVASMVVSRLSAVESSALTGRAAALAARHRTTERQRPNRTPPPSRWPCAALSQTW